ncbi:tripartite tricarboxylate transporter TctB family protein [Propionivibrio soli]|uniref:tripartite tricarboxylate transporter TctB family protein n=1 Tax=Propionivibrio soli TaxID=2976531 RepID=UPI0021E90152|nr:tripartite tricarboxylate transporter TctB family protein [Propionivibrio soli]
MAAEIVFNILIGLGVLFYLAQAIQLPATDNPADVLGAGGFPIIIGVIALIGLAMITIHTIKEKRKVDIPMLNLRSVDGRMVFINVLVLAAYVGLLDVIGFVLATLIYLVVAPLSMGYRKPAALAVFSGVTTAVMVVVFGILFYVPLPRGAELFRDLSYLIY